MFTEFRTLHNTDKPLREARFLTIDAISDR
jgi:hypothetical protein